MPESSSQTREALLEAAQRLFSSRGYAEVGIREIAEQAGANVASIKYYFGSKHDLYLESVRQAMGHYDGESLSEMLAEAPADDAAAATQLVRFIQAFFHRSSQRREMDACGLLMLREALQPSEAIDAVVRDYLKPRTDDLVSVLGVLMPDTPGEELLNAAHWLLGQLMHFRIFRPFIERLSGIDFADEAVSRRVARSIAAFSLRGLGCDEQTIENALHEAQKQHTMTPRKAQA
ncbi:MAG: CerR family C-terminal domain-containing protein [Planctomycetota bacterium]|nr:CerR family C-terminal domain-containing protein [Planctomycetota bacterium]